MTNGGRPLQAEPGASLISALREPRCYPHPVRGIRIMETHISWVLLTGDYAYKIKKPVDLGFADFSTLALRRRYCEEEVRLNRRFAAGLYLDVVAIRGSPQRPAIDGSGPTLEHAVKMREFAQDALAANLLADGRLDAELLEAFAHDVAKFHGSAARAPADTAYGLPDTVMKQAKSGIDTLLALAADAAERERLDALAQWTAREGSRLQAVFAARRQGGFVRDCHGDLHLGNIVRLEKGLVPFDCIEFNDALRFIDVMSEVAFPVMDFAHAGRRDLGTAFLDAYLEASGDYEGLAVLPFYLVYRALVRATVRALHARGRAKPERGPESAAGYTELAARCAAGGQPALLVMHGLSGSGKSTIARALARAFGAMRVRSDVERKRMHGRGALDRTGSPLDGGIYSEERTRAAYRRLADLARAVVGAGFPVIVDAASLARWQRDAMRALAAELALPFVIVDVQAPPGTLRERVARRSAAGTDASEAGLAVLERQLEAGGGLQHDELPLAVAVSGAEAMPADVLREIARRTGLVQNGAS